jgi:membrane carboxypeptidase/penicillin-binding protein
MGFRATRRQLMSTSHPKLLPGSLRRHGGCAKEPWTGPLAGKNGTEMERIHDAWFIGLRSKITVECLGSGYDEKKPLGTHWRRCGLRRCRFWMDS